MATKILRVFQEFTSEGYVPMPPTGNIDYGFTIAGTFPTTTPATFQTDNPDLEVTVTEVTDFYVWIRSHGTEWNYQYTRNVRVYPDSPSINNVVMGIIIANLGNTVPYTGATKNVDLGEFGITQGYSKFDLTPTNTPTTAGTMSWNDGDGTLDLILKGGNVTLQLGQELVARCYNAEATTLVDGEIVYIYGSQGNRVSVKRASASSEMSSSVTFGMVTEHIASGAEGFVTISGVVNKLDTSGLTAGTALWLGTTPGTYTPTKPVAPIHSVLIGYVERVHATVGSIYVKVQNGYELDELHNVKITTPTENDFLVYDDTQQVWENRAVIKANGYIPYFDSTDLFKQSPILVDGVNVTMNGMPLLLSDEGQLNYITKFGSTKTVINSLLYDTGTKVGINTTNPEYLFTVVGGAMGVYSSSTNYGFIDTANTSMRLVSANGFNFTANNIGTIANTRVDANGNWGFGIGTPAYKVDVNGDVNTNGIYRINGSQITTANVLENASFLYFTQNRVLSTILTGLNPALSGTMTATDSLIEGLSKVQYQLNNKENTITAGTTAQYWRGDKTWRDFNTDARASLSFVAGSGAYNSTTGVITIPTNTNQLTNGASFITLASLSASSPLSYNSGTGAFSISQASGTTNGFLSSTDWTTFNNKQNALGYTPVPTTRTITINGTTYDLSADRSWTIATGIGGSGTTNYLPKFTGSTTLGNSLVYDNGSGVGINATTIYTKLDVRGVDGAAIAYFYNNTTTAGQVPGVVIEAGTNASDYSLDVRSSGGTSYLKVIGNGNVGIGTSSPSAKLEILGGNIRLANTAQIEWGGSTNAIDASNATNVMRFWTNNVQRLTIDASGNLGLGVTPSAWGAGTYGFDIGPGSAFYNPGSGNQTQILNNSYHNGTNFIYKNNAQAARYRMLGDSHEWHIAPSGTAGTAISFTQAMTLDASGNLLLGVTSGSSRAVIKGGNNNTLFIDNDGSAYTSINIGFNGTQRASIVRDNRVGYERLYIESNQGRLDLLANTNMIFASGTGYPERMRINYDTGNVSIGNTNNTYKLDVSGITRISSDLLIQNTFNPFNSTNRGNITLNGTADNIVAFTDNTNIKGYVYHDGTNIQLLNNVTGGYLSLFTQGTEKVRVTSSGNVGIGTTSPSGILHLYKAAEPEIYLQNSSAIFRTGLNSESDYFVYTSNAKSIYFATSGSERMRITSTGNVGIGTTSPTSLLHVNTSGSAVGGIKLTSSTNTNGSAFVASNAGGDSYFGRNNATGGAFGGTAYATVVYSGGAYPMAFYTNDTEQMRITSAGNVGIGTTSPGYKLDVSGTTRITSGLLLDRTATSSSSYIQLSTATSLEWYLGTNALGTNLTNFYIYRYGGVGTVLDISASTGAATFSSSVTAYGNASSSNAYNFYNNSGNSGTAQYYAEFGNGAGFVAGRILRGNGASGFVPNGLSILSWDSLQLSANATGGSGGSIQLLGGNVGIGTTSPADALHVATSNEYQISWSRTIAGKRWAFGTDSSATYISNRTDNTIPFYLTNGGNVGIGTISPSAQLHATGSVIIGSAPSSVFKFNVNPTGSNFISFWIPTIGGVNSNGIISHGGGGYTNQLPLGYFATQHIFNGEVTGGGTMQVNGDVNISGTFRVNGTAIGTGGGGVSGSGTAAYVPKWSGSTSLTNSNIYVTSTNQIKINTTSSSNLMIEATGGSDSNLYTTLTGNLRAIARFSQDISTFRGLGIGYDAGDQMGFIYGTTAALSTASKIGFIVSNGSEWRNMLIVKGNTVSMPILPSSTSGLTLGDLYVDANGFVKRYNVV